jgi:hypothetical protein
MSHLSSRQRQAIYAFITLAEADISKNFFATIQDRLIKAAQLKLADMLHREFNKLGNDVIKALKTETIGPNMFETSVDWTGFEFKLSMKLRNEFGKLAQDTVDGISQYLTSKYSWDIETVPAVTDWLNRYTAELVVEITEETRAIIRDIVSKNYLTWIASDVKTMTQDLRPFVGLTEYQKKVVENYRAKLLAEKAAGIYRSPAQIEEMVRNKAKRILWYRCQMIAETESNFVSNNASLALYRESSEINASQWFATKGACPKCAALDGKVVNIDETFAMGTVKVNGIKIARAYKHPPLHPRCWCRIIPVTVDTVQDAEYWASRQEMFAQNQSKSWKKQYNEAIAAA